MSKIEYINVWDYHKPGIHFMAFVGGRGTGKTYSCLEGLIEKECPFIYMRRTLDELDECCDNPRYGEGENPFKSLNDDFGWNYGLLKTTKKTAGIFTREVDEKDKITHVGAPIGYGVALSTIASMRGIDLSDADYLFYDEFITETHVRKIKDEGLAFLNAIETIARNRELKGKNPLLVILCANAFNIYNPIFQELGIISSVERMINRHQADAYFFDRGLSVHLLKPTKSFVEKKKGTALYKLTKGTKFYDVALKNEFAFNDFSLIGYKKLTGYQPMCSFDDKYVYRKKGAQEFYITYSPARCEHFNVQTKQGLASFYCNYGKLLRAYFVESAVTFETYEIKMAFLDAVGIK